MAFPSCFVALKLPPTPALLALQERLEPPLRRIHPDDLHLTLAYLGRIDPALDALLLPAIAALPFAGAAVELASVLPLPSREQPSALVLDLRSGPGKDAIVALMTAHRPALQRLASRPEEDHPPLPHVTFARPRGRRMDADKRAAILRWADTQPPLGCPLELGRAVLMRSKPPGGPGPHYFVL